VPSILYIGEGKLHSAKQEGLGTLSDIKRFIAKHTLIKERKASEQP
jgi:hypothetical protein